MKRNWISWFVILLIAIGLPTLRVVSDIRKSHAPTPEDKTADFQTELTAKAFVGQAHFLPDNKAQLMDSLKPLDKTPAQRVAAAVLAGELLGRDAAIERLSGLDGDDAKAFRAFYSDATPLPAEVSKRYGFVAEVAESIGKPETDAKRAAVLSAGKRTFGVFGAAALVVVGAGLLSFALFVTAIVLMSLGKVRPNVAPPEPREGSLYVQGFAIYLGVFVFSSLALTLFERTHPDVVPDAVKFLPIIVGFALGAIWPMLRGARWPRMREDWGLHAGRNIIIEPLFGMAGYLAGLPLVAAGFGMMFVLQKMSGATVTPPIDPRELIAHPLQLMLLAVVWAPITEELMFRGAFLSHLRQRFNPWISAVLSGVVFAAIHPQGWAAIPLLGSVGFVLAMVRQWRRSITASMAAHALNNGTITVFLLLAAG